MFFLSTLLLVCATHGQPVQAAPYPLAGASLSQNAPASPSSEEKTPSPPSSPGEKPPQKKNDSTPPSYAFETALFAHQFLSYLLKKDWNALLPLASFPFWLESKAYPSPQTLREAWEAQLSQKYLDNYEIGGIEVLSFQQMKERFGPPPERLQKTLSHHKSLLFAVANLSGRAVVLFLLPASRYSPPKVVAFHD